MLLDLIALLYKSLSSNAFGGDSCSNGVLAETELASLLFNSILRIKKCFTVSLADSLELVENGDRRWYVVSIGAYWVL